MSSNQGEVRLTRRQQAAVTECPSVDNLKRAHAVLSLDMLLGSCSFGKFAPRSPDHCRTLILTMKTLITLMACSASHVSTDSEHCRSHRLPSFCCVAPVPSHFAMHPCHRALPQEKVQ